MGKKRSAETREKISKTLTGRKLSAEHVENLRKSHSGEKNPIWKGGRFIDKHDGYVWIHRPSHPLAKKNGYVREHRFVMSEYIGRPLTRCECIHHINGNRSDNRIENLLIVSHADHMRLEHTGRKRSAETRKRMAQAQKDRRSRERNIL